MEKELFELMTKLYNKVESIENKFEKMESEMHEMKENMATKDDVDKINSRLDSVEQSIVKLENKMDNKLSALFDAREVGIDKETEISTGLQRVESKVDKLELKVLRNNLHLPSINEK